LWGVLCLNVTAGIGIIGMASPMLQEVFGGKLIGIDVAFNDLTTEQKTAIAAVAAGFTGLLSLFNIGGRFVWASLSDKIGRKMTYYTFFLLGFALYAAIPSTAQGGSLALFVAFFCIILSMYGGGFATIPAYLADMFGTKFVGAIHGRLLTAWAAAGIFGPVLVNYIREYQLDHGVARADAYTITMYILSGLLILGFICNWLVTEVDEVHHMTAEQHAEEKKIIADEAHQHFGADVSALAVEVSHSWKVTLAWMAVWIPLAWGIWITVQKTIVLFK
jgi:MFS family permease